MNSDRMQKAKAERKRLQLVVIEEAQWQTCLNCLHWTQRTTIVEQQDGTFITSNDEYCGKFNGTPPPRIIVNGCDHHENDIPF